MLIILVLVLAWFGLDRWQAARTAKTQANLSTNQTGAAQANGKDAVAVVGARAATETAGDTLTRSNEDAIRSAKGADAPVDPAVRDAGLVGLCRRAAYSRDPRCLRFTPAR